MGLDMYAYRIDSKYAQYLPNATADKLGQDILDEISEGSVEIAYWRKHNRLHGWFAKEYANVSGDDNPRNFNCVNLIITPEMLERLEDAYFNDGYPETSGFFFGYDSDGWYEEEDWAFICATRRAIKQGYTVYYFAWW